MDILIKMANSENTYHLKEIYDELVQKLQKSRNVTAEEIEFLCHVTTDENLTEIKRSGYLGESELEYCKDIKGVWTIASKDKDGDLHSQSPYGTKRLKFRIKDICEDPEEWALFFERTYPIGGGITPTNQYIRLVLIRPHNHISEYHWCFWNLYLLKLHENPFLKITEDKDISELTAGVSAMPFPPPTRTTYLSGPKKSISYAYNSIKCKTTRLCLSCGLHVTECEGKCPCKACGQSVDFCSKMGIKCDPTRKKTKLNLYVEVFVVDFSKTVDINDVVLTETTKGLPKGIPEPKVPPDHRFFHEHVATCTRRG